MLKAYMILPRPWQASVPPVRDRKYIEWVRTQPCAVCSSFRWIEAAHTGGRGLGQKADDTRCIPLCRAHHQKGNLSLHKLGPVRFALLYHLEVAELIRELQEMYLGASGASVSR
jgi:hypothetical protein